MSSWGKDTIAETLVANDVHGGPSGFTRRWRRRGELKDRSL